MKNSCFTFNYALPGVATSCMGISSFQTLLTYLCCSLKIKILAFGWTQPMREMLTTQGFIWGSVRKVKQGCDNEGGAVLLTQSHQGLLLFLSVPSSLSKDQRGNNKGCVVLLRCTRLDSLQIQHVPWCIGAWVVTVRPLSTIFGVTAHHSAGPRGAFPCTYSSSIVDEETRLTACLLNRFTIRDMICRSSVQLVFSGFSVHYNGNGNTGWSNEI